MNTWTFEKRAGVILDQQDDPGFWWEKIAHFWPEYLEEPQVGIEKKASDCIGYFDSGHEKIARYPISSPEETLASSMYFASKGVEYLSKEAHVPVGKRLKDARVAWGVDMPDGFVEFVKTASVDKPQEEIYADTYENFPVTTKSQCNESISMFEKTAERLPCAERAVVGRKLKEAADVHSIDRDVPYSQTEMSKNASGAIKKRMAVMKRMPDHAGKVEYLSKLEGISENISQKDYQSMIKGIEGLERMDKSASMDQGWNVHFPDPAKTFLEGLEDNPFNELEKRASYDNIDFEGLREKFDDHIVDEISSDPDAVIPTLPGPHKKIVKDYINEQKRV